MKSLLVLLTSALFSVNSFAIYCATGDIEAHECSGFIIKSCGFTRVDAIEKDGKYYEPARCYKDVNNYSASKERCWITTKSTGLGFINTVFDSVVMPTFYHIDKENNYEKIDPESITFKCTKR